MGTEHIGQVSRIEGNGLPRGRRLTGFVLAVAGPPVLAGILDPLRSQVNLAGDMLLFLALTVVVALVGGVLPALTAAVLGAFGVNYFFTPPRHTLAVDDTTNVLALVVFVAVGAVVSTMVDLAERRRREAADVRIRLAEEAALRAPLEAANKLRTALLAAVGHDLRTPLAVSKAAVSSLRSRDVELVEADRDELLATADESLDRLADLVDNLLDLSRLQVGALPTRLQSVPVDEVVARALDDLGAVTVGLDLPDDLPTVLCDPGLLERVLVNLVENALRYSGPTPPRLVVRARDGRVELRIVDHGPGIPVADRDQVFVPFQRLGDTDNTTGLGLGLALARGLTEAMGGTLDAGESEGGGLTMVVSLAEGYVDVAEPGRVERGSGSADA